MIAHNDGCGNTRLIPLTISCHLDYLRIRARLTPEKFADLLDFVGSKYIGVLPETPWSPGGGAVWFPNKIVDCHGIFGGYTEDLESNLVDIMLEFSGQYFASISVVDQWRLLTGLKHAFSVKCSRIDLAIDDYTYDLIPVDNMVDSWQEGNNFYFSSYKMITSGNRPENMLTTHYFGSRNSGKMVRVYDHESECLRFEAEFKRGYSQLIFDALSTLERGWFVDGNLTKSDCLSSINQWSKSLDIKDSKLLLSALLNELHGCNQNYEMVLQNIIGAIAVSAIDFRDRSSRKDRSKASFSDTKRLDFYQKFIEKVGFEFKVKPVTKKVSISRTVVWMFRQVSKTMSIIKDSLGIVEYKNWESKFLEFGRDKQKLRDLKLIQYIQDNPSVISFGC